MGQALNKVNSIYDFSFSSIKKPHDVGDIVFFLGTRFRDAK